MHTKFGDSRFSRSRDMIADVQIENGSCVCHYVCMWINLIDWFDFRAVRPRSSGQILLPRYFMTGLGNLNETRSEYSLAPIASLIGLWTGGKWSRSQQAVRCRRHPRRRWGVEVHFLFIIIIYYFIHKIHFQRLLILYVFACWHWKLFRRQLTVSQFCGRHYIRGNKPTLQHVQEYIQYLSI